MREGVTGRLRNQWTTTTQHASRFRWRLTSAILNRVAPAADLESLVPPVQARLGGIQSESM